MHDSLFFLNQTTIIQIEFDKQNEITPSKKGRKDFHSAPTSEIFVRCGPIGFGVIFWCIPLKSKYTKSISLSDPEIYKIR